MPMNNKKAQLGITGFLLEGLKGIFTGLVDGIKALLDIIPKPIKIILFLLIILLLGNFINLGIRYFGIHCDSQGNPVKVSNLISNNELIQATPDYDNIGISGEEIGTPDNVLPFIGYAPVYTLCTKNINNPIIESNKDLERTQLIGNYWFYDSNICQPCPNGVTYAIYQGDGEGNILYSLKFGDSYCYGNVYRTNLSWFAKTFFCGGDTMSQSLCRVPEHHYYDYNQNLYICDDDTCQNTTIGSVWDNLLVQARAKSLYQESYNGTGDEITRAVGITCNELKPRLTVFGIDVFDYIYWILALVIAFLIWALINLKKV